MSDTALAAEVHDVVEPGQAAVAEGLGVEADTLGDFARLLGAVQSGQQAILAAHAALAAQMAAQHDAQMRAIAALVIRQSGL